MRGVGIVLIAASGLLAPGTGRAGETETAYGIKVLAGLDSNPLEVADQGPNGMFTQLQVDGSVVWAVRPSFGFFALGDLRTRLHESGTENADSTSGYVRSGFSLAPARLDHRLLLSAGGTYTIGRETFTDHSTGQAYEASVVPATDPPSTTPIPDRLDYDSAGLFVNVRWRQNHRLRLFLETRLAKTDYIQDYQANTGLDPLDFESLTFRPGATIVAGPSVALTVSAMLSDLDYDARPALDPMGAVVAGTTRSYRYTQYQVSMRIAPNDQWTIRTGLSGGGRDDTYAGYYDSVSHAAYVSLARDLNRANRINFYASMRDLEYDNATVSGLPDDEINESEIQRYLTRFERDINRSTRWFAEAGTLRSDSRDPVFTYDRDWIHTGFHFAR